MQILIKTSSIYMLIARYPVELKNISVLLYVRIRIYFCIGT